MVWSLQALSNLVFATSWSLFALSSTFFALRLYTRSSSPGVGLHLDDYILIAGWVFLLLTSTCVTWLMVEFVDAASLTKITLARAHLCLQSIALGLTKTSFAITLLRLFPRGWEHVVIWALTLSMNAQFIAHMFATWQPVCGVPDQGHLPVKCWTIHQTVTFAVFCASYSAACDFILALLPWKMIFNLQMKRSERIGVALTLSTGILAGVTGILKAYHADLLDDFSRPDRIMYNQAMNWVWAQAEPNVTIISASIPVLRGFTRNIRNKSSGSTSGPYVRTGNSSSAYGRNGRGPRRDEMEGFDGSDTSILGPAPRNGADGKRGDVVMVGQERFEEYGHNGATAIEMKSMGS